MTYTDRQEDLREDTKRFVQSELGTHIMSILDEMLAGYLTAASSVTEPNKEWYLAKYNALKEVQNLILQPLDDDKLSRG